MRMQKTKNEWMMNLARVEYLGDIMDKWITINCNKRHRQQRKKKEEAREEKEIKDQNDRRALHEQQNQ